MKHTRLCTGHVPSPCCCRSRYCHYRHFGGDLTRRGGLTEFCGGGCFVGRWTHRSGVGGEDDGHRSSRSLFNCKYNIKNRKKKTYHWQGLEMRLEPHFFHFFPWDSLSLVFGPFFSLPAAGLTNWPPVRDSDPRAPLF